MSSAEVMSKKDKSGSIQGMVVVILQGDGMIFYFYVIE